MSKEKQTTELNTKLGLLKVIKTFHVAHHPITGEELQYDKVLTELKADWLTEEMADEYMRWENTGFTADAPSFLED